MPEGGEAIRDWVRSNLGIHFTTDQLPLLNARVQGLCRERKTDANTLLSRLHAGDHELSLRVAEMAATNHTYFFREPEVFEYLCRVVLPELDAQPKIRWWSAAASSGDEAYTLAILARERWGDLARRVCILGTDISQRQVDQAERACYPRVQVAAMGNDPRGEPRLARYFRPSGLGQYQLADELRAMCSFRRLNLTQLPWPFDKRFHLICLRNVLYYFEPHTRRAVIEGCYDVTERGGYLLTSLTEPLLDVSTRWRLVQPGIYRKEEA